MTAPGVPTPDVTAPPTGATTGLGEDGWAAGDGVRLHYVARGSGPLVLLLHGFPDFWYGWRHQLGALADAGLRAVAVDLRGYNLSSRPAEVADYALDRLAADVVALARALGDGRPVHVVGHDWGGAIAWRVAARHPEVVGRLAILNAPHPGRYAELLGRSAQALESWYIAAVQLPLVPDALLGARDRALLHATWTAMHHRPSAFTDEDHVRYDAAFRSPGALRAALAYYRAAACRPGVVFGGPREEAGDRDVVRRPTLVVWGEDDPALVRANANGLERWVPDVRVERVSGAGHFVQADAPEAVNRALVAHFAGAAAAAGGHA